MWIRDVLGRVGVLVGDRVVYASGEQAAPADYTELLNARAAEYEFSKQRDKMWRVCEEFQSLSRAVLAKLLRRTKHRPGSLYYEELLQDIGLECMRRAALIHDESRCPMRGYLHKCLTRAYAKAIGLERRSHGDNIFRDGSDGRWLHMGDDLDMRDRGRMNDLSDPSYSVGLEDTEQLSTIVERAGLTEQDVELLLLRYDSEITLRDLAAHMNVASPQTALNIINKLLERCRRVT